MSASFWDSFKGKQKDDYVLLETLGENEEVREQDWANSPPQKRFKWAQKKHSWLVGTLIFLLLFYVFTPPFSITDLPTQELSQFPQTNPRTPNQLPSKLRTWLTMARSLHLDKVSDPLERLRLLNEDYDYTVDGFGVADTSWQRYVDNLKRIYTDLFGLPEASEGGELDEEASDAKTVRQEEPYWSNTSPTLFNSLPSHLSTALCYASPNCTLPAVSPIPDSMYMTTKFSEPSGSIPSYRSQSPTLKIHQLPDPIVWEYVNKVFKNRRINCEFWRLPVTILKFDLVRLLLVFDKGGWYSDEDTRAVRNIKEWGVRLWGVNGRTEADEIGGLYISDPISDNLSVNHLKRQSDAPVPPPSSLTVAIEWHSLKPVYNKHSPNYTRSAGVVQWAFGANAGHPVLLNAIGNIIANSRGVLNEGSAQKDRLSFDPSEDRMVLEWSGPAILTDCVARYLRTRYGISLDTLAGYEYPVQIGDVTILPMGSLNSRLYWPLRVLDWVLGRNYGAFWSGEERLVHLHSASWWGKKIDIEKHNRKILEKEASEGLSSDSDPKDVLFEQGSCDSIGSIAKSML